MEDREDQPDVKAGFFDLRAAYVHTAARRANMDAASFRSGAAEGGCTRIATITIGTISMQGVLLRRLPGGMARIVIRGRVYLGRYVPPMRGAS